MTDETTDAAARAWLEKYEVAWTSNDPSDVRALFTEDARYLTAPFRPPRIGHDAIVQWWTTDGRDDQGDWTFRGEVIGTDGARAFVEGVTTYTTDTDYANLWVIDFAPDGRARAFTEWWMTRPDDVDAPGATP